MGHQHLAGGRRHCDQGVATKIELRDGNYNGKGQGTDGGGEGIRAIQKIQQRGVFSDRREAKFSSGGAGSTISIRGHKTNRSRSARARAIPNYFPAKGEAQGEVSSEKMHRGAGGLV